MNQILITYFDDIDEHLLYWLNQRFRPIEFRFISDGAREKLVYYSDCNSLDMLHRIIWYIEGWEDRSR